MKREREKKLRGKEVKLMKVEKLKEKNWKKDNERKRGSWGKFWDIEVRWDKDLREDE